MMLLLMTAMAASTESVANIGSAGETIKGARATEGDLGQQQWIAAYVSNIEYNTYLCFFF